MKTLGLILLSLLACAPAAAQSPAGPAPAPEAHGVSVVRASWRKQVFNPALLEDPLSASDATAQLLREKKEITRENNERAKSGMRLRPMPTRAPGEPATGPSELPPSDPRVSYVYEVKVVNTGTKKISSLVWEYVLFDPATEREVGRHAFESKAGIPAGKTKSLTGLSTTPPATVVDVKQTDKEWPGQFSERVEIQRVVYDDGTVWERGRQ